MRQAAIAKGWILATAVLASGCGYKPASPSYPSTPEEDPQEAAIEARTRAMRANQDLARGGGSTATATTGASTELRDETDDLGTNNPDPAASPTAGGDGTPSPNPSPTALATPNPAGVGSAGTSPTLGGGGATAISPSTGRGLASAPISGGGATPVVGSGQTFAVSIQNAGFSAPTLTVPAGSTVIWTNLDVINHTLQAANDAFDTGPIAPGGSVSLVVAVPGSYPYTSQERPAVAGTLVVNG